MKKVLIVSFICIVVSCAFSTRGGITQSKPSTTLIHLKQDTVIKYVERQPLSKKEQAQRDTSFRRYIASIIQPYTDDLKNSNYKDISTLTFVLQRQSKRLDSINNLRYIETLEYQKASTERDSSLLQSIVKDKRIDSLQSAVNRIENTNIEATKISQGLTNLIITVRDLAIYLILGLGFIFISLTLFLEWLRLKKRNRYKILKQDG